jgi:arylamine N-acetyltransferase
MKPNEFADRLNEVQDLMAMEKYKEALQILHELKELDKTSDFDYNLTHKLYQLDSNTRSLYNQQIILKRINSINEDTKMISVAEFNELLKHEDKLSLEEPILRRELEILVLRGIISIEFKGNMLKL